MHLQIVLAFVMLLWWPLERAGGPPVTSTAWVLLIVWAKVPVITWFAWLVNRSTLARLRREPNRSHSALTFYHRATTTLRLVALAGLAADLFATSWPDMLFATPVLSAVPGLVHLILLVPYFLCLTAILWMLYPVERASRDVFAAPPRWTRGQYVIFNIRHQVLIVALPLTLILVAYVATRDYRRPIAEAFRSPWAPDAILVIVAGLVFLFAPVMLRHIWSTSPLPDGPLRRKLLALCDRIGLRVREILVWHSDGVMVNAAVMGLVPRVRYILLSDALLDAMSDEEVEAVFGHEAGHVRYHHIQYFLVFAILSMLIVSGIIEYLLHLALNGGPIEGLSRESIQVIGLVAAVPIWGFAFGWISRRFERQADTFGARCATPATEDVACRRPCVAHDGLSTGYPEAICSTGAATFLGALRKVAVLNGIPIEERSWRHSSIASRMHFLTAIAHDPIMTRRFGRLIWWIKFVLLASCAVGLVIAAAYIWRHPAYHQDFIRSVIEPVKRIFQ